MTTHTNVVAAELDELRRRKLGQTPDGREPEVTPDGLVGLAISGGGIRSATFALGVLEGLKRAGALKKLHYLSTVSGGGYIGAWLTANCARHEHWLDDDPNWLDPSTPWNRSVAHLRRYSNYLSPQVGFFSADTWTMAAIWIRNTLLVQITVILAIACALIVPRPLFEGFMHWPDVGQWRWLSVVLFLLGVVGIAGNELVATGRGATPVLVGKNWKPFTAAAAVLTAVAYGFARWVHFDPFIGGELSYAAAAPLAILFVVIAFLLQPVAVTLARRTRTDYTQGWVQGLVVLPMMVVGYLVAAILWGESQPVAGAGPGLSTFATFGEFVTDGWRYWPFPLAVMFASTWMLSLCSLRNRTWRGWLAACLAPVVAVVVLHVLLGAIMVLFHGWAQASAHNARHAFVWGPPLVLYAFSVAIVMLIGMMGLESLESVREWWSRLGAWLGIYGFAWMIIALAAVYGGDLVRALMHTHPWSALTAGGGWIGTTVAGLLAGGSGSTGAKDSKTQKGMGAKALEVVAAVAPFVFIGGLLIGVSATLDHFVIVGSRQDWYTLTSAHETHARFLTLALTLLGACGAGLALMAWRVDINEFSLNAFYRNRLVRCYLGATRFEPGVRKPQLFTGFDEHDDVQLADLRTTQLKTPGPLHIINCALNLGGSTDLALHTRHSAEFSLSPLFCGSAYPSRESSGATQELGFIPTRDYGGHAGAPTIGQAIAVSGAAASPNMGYHTSPVIAFLLTLFNVRLGWWFPNPRHGVNRPSPAFSLRYLVAELFGGADDKSRFLMISDGGHFENLAAYELIARRCRVIFISDGECDPELTFEGLGTLIRVCEVDFGVRIALDVSALRRTAASAWSTSRCAVGHIDYGPNHPPGILVYFKASMTGREDTAVLQYKSGHDAFPHESTGDQFFAEDQFESYRRLGRDIAHRTFAPTTADEDVLARAEATFTELGLPLPNRTLRQAAAGA